MKLELDAGLVQDCRAAAKKIAADVQSFIESRTTEAVERAVLRLLDINEAWDDVPMANIIVEILAARGELGQGAAYWLGNACKVLGLSPKRLPGRWLRASWTSLRCPGRPPRTWSHSSGSWRGRAWRESSPTGGGARS